MPWREVGPASPAGHRIGSRTPTSRSRVSGPFFRSGTGHGAGLEVHEPPRIAESSDTVLEAGMVVTVEPGIYIPGKWGVRIEDLVLVMEDGYEILSRVSKDLHIL